jgi:hypothetical protein
MSACLLLHACAGRPLQRCEPQGAWPQQAPHTPIGSWLPQQAPPLPHDCLIRQPPWARPLPSLTPAIFLVSLLLPLPPAQVQLKALTWARPLPEAPSSKEAGLNASGLLTSHASYLTSLADTPKAGGPGRAGVGAAHGPLSKRLRITLLHSSQLFWPPCSSD